jgi:hypothetical protein
MYITHTARRSLDRGNTPRSRTDGRAVMLDKRLNFKGETFDFCIREIYTCQQKAPA